MATGIWFCHDKNCRIQVAGGAYTYTTTAAASIRSAVRRLREMKEACVFMELVAPAEAIGKVDANGVLPMDDFVKINSAI